MTTFYAMFAILTCGTVGAVVWLILKLIAERLLGSDVFLLVMRGLISVLAGALVADLGAHRAASAFYGLPYADVKALERTRDEVERAVRLSIVRIETHACGEAAIETGQAEQVVKAVVACRRERADKTKALLEAQERVNSLIDEAIKSGSGVVATAALDGARDAVARIGE